MNSRALKKYEINNEEIYLIYHDIEKPYCKYCGHPLKYKSFRIGYLLDSCTNSCPGTIKRRESGVYKNHGVINGFQTKRSKERIIEKYGVENPFFSRDIQEICKIKMTETKAHDDWKETIGKKSSEMCSKTMNSEEWKPTTGQQQKSRIRETRENRGHWIPIIERKSFDIYRYYVWKETEKQDLKSLENYDKRGRSDIDENAYHIFNI